MSWSLAGTGLLLLVAFGVLHKLGWALKTQAVFALVGACLIGASAGKGMRYIVIGVTWISRLADIATVWLVGASVGGAVIFLILAILLIHHLHPKTGESKHGGWIALALGLILVAGVSGFVTANNLPANIRQGVTTVRTAVNGG